MAPHFLCCLPIRFGAFIISLISLGIAILVAGIAWAGVYLDDHPNAIKDPRHQIPDFKLSRGQKIMLIVYGVIYTLFTVVSLFGLIGVLIKRVNYVRTFSGFLRGFLIATSILSIIQLVLFFVKKDNNCTLGSESSGTCVKSQGLSTGAVIAIVIVVILIPILFLSYACWIISDCIKYIEDQHVGSRNVGMYPFSQPYAAVKPHEVDLHHPYNKPYDSQA
ncbi:hypothetical protein E1B28_000443 [Marasmius oreades]|uniref:Uncharacterized protein n=1 Tax=Marasmius oreades TaxID=181124 RepID=A0A9P7V1B5_9AGAR|nr:uncharacterized protein E1B28_000443 [Marasmius oreades]KAG7098499.1 hypothetical protein E1B28_000443 [Marasmius oreades]